MRNLPNLLTLLRILLVPVFVWLVFFCSAPNSIAWALLVFAVASFTDFLDGYLARKWQVISNFGKIMDPLADKLLVLSALTALTLLQPFKLYPLILILIALREVLVSLLREVYVKKGIVIPADKLGKLKTVLQMFGIIAALVLWAWFEDLAASAPVRTIAHIWFGAVALLTAYSGLNYLVKAQMAGKKE